MSIVDGRYHYPTVSTISYGHSDDVDVYCCGEYVETVRRGFNRVSSQWSVKFETRAYRVFLKGARFAIEIDDEYAFKYTFSGSFPDG